MVGHSPIQVPQLRSIEVTIIDLYRTQDIDWQSKAEQVSHVSAVLDKDGPLHPDVHVHVAVLVELMSKMSGMRDPR